MLPRDETQARSSQPGQDQGPDTGHVRKSLTASSPAVAIHPVATTPIFRKATNVTMQARGHVATQRSGTPTARQLDGDVMGELQQSLAALRRSVNSLSTGR